jgi:hypothetical protein
MLDDGRDKAAWQSSGLDLKEQAAENEALLVDEHAMNSFLSIWEFS